MSITQPTREELEAVDWEALKAIEDAARKGHFAGTLTKAGFASLWKRGLKAANGSTDQLVTLAMFEP